MTDMFWAPQDATIVDRPELYFIACPRAQGYLNQCTRLKAQTPEQAEQLLAEVSQAHLTAFSRVMVLDPERARRERHPLLTALKNASYAPDHLGDACVFDVEDVAHRVAKSGQRPADSFRMARVTTTGELRDFVQVIASSFDQSTHTSAAEEKTYLDACRSPTGRVHRVIAYDRASGTPLSVGGMNLYPDLGFGLLWGGATVPSGRGRGGYGAVLRERLLIASRLGIRTVGLYAIRETSSPIVQAFGFRKVGEMTYWERQKR